MNRGVPILRHHPLRNQNGIFEVVAVPGHEGNQHVLAQGQLAGIGRGAIRHHVPLGDMIAHLDDGTLIDIGILVGAGVLDQIIDIDPDLTGNCLVVIDPHHDTRSIDIIDNPPPQSDHGSTRVHRHGTLDSGPDQRLLRTQTGHSLTLHVGTHQGAVGIVMFQEGNERSRHRHDLARRHVHVIDPRRLGQNGFALFTAGH
ncbi:MAG: hypothetical protein BWY57_02856 [Betaproteobacteria bacterium ADurb.Bin341]|nr:MAG: hypothetical protein BWY57_02856 [Betaproteobacteria bacterium ADurb.Bin341]